MKAIDKQRFAPYLEGQMGEIARVQDKIRRFRQRVDARNRRLECADHVLVDCLFVEADVRIADLDKTETAFFHHAVHVAVRRNCASRQKH